MRASNTSHVEISVPSHESAKVAGTKSSVTSHRGGEKSFCTAPITSASSRYSTLAAATAPPALKATPVPSSSSVPLTKLPAVMSAKATIT